jgi:hypothetical protein
MNSPCRFAGCTIASSPAAWWAAVNVDPGTIRTRTLAPDPRCRFRAANQIVGVDHPWATPDAVKNQRAVVSAAFSKARHLRCITACCTACWACVARRTINQHRFFRAETSKSSVCLPSRDRSRRTPAPSRSRWTSPPGDERLGVAPRRLHNFVRGRSAAPK